MALSIAHTSIKVFNIAAARHYLRMSLLVCALNWVPL